MECGPYYRFMSVAPVKIDKRPARPQIHTPLTPQVYTSSSYGPGRQHSQNLNTPKRQPVLTSTWLKAHNPGHPQGYNTINLQYHIARHLHTSSQHFYIPTRLNIHTSTPYHVQIPTRQNAYTLTFNMSAPQHYQLPTRK